MSKGAYYLITLSLGLLLLANHHLGYSIGDSIFKMLGIPSKLQKGNTGFHMPVIIGWILIITGFIGAKNYYRPTSPQILSRLVLGCIVFLLLSPYVSEGLMFLLKYNAAGRNSMDISNSSCYVRTEENKLLADCSFTIYNYGELDQIIIKPTLSYEMLGKEQIDFGVNTLALEPHRKMNIRIPFKGTPKDGSYSMGPVKDVEYDIEVIK